MDEARIRKLLSYIEECLNRLDWLMKKRQDETDEEQLYLIQGTLERRAEEIIEAAIKINQILLKEKGAMAESYYKSFTKLEIFSLGKDFLKRLGNTAGFRNRLAHEYMDLEEGITIKTIENILDLYPQYVLEIKKLLGDKKGH